MKIDGWCHCCFVSHHCIHLATETARHSHLQTYHNQIVSVSGDTFSTQQPNSYKQTRIFSAANTPLLNSGLLASCQSSHTAEGWGKICLGWHGIPLSWFFRETLKETPWCPMKCTVGAAAMVHVPVHPIQSNSAIVESTDWSSLSYGHGYFGTQIIREAGYILVYPHFLYPINSSIYRVQSQLYPHDMPHPMEAPSYLHE